MRIEDSTHSADYARRHIHSTEAVLALTASKLVNALQRLHESGIIHGALTPWSFDFTRDGVTFNDMTFAHTVEGVPISFESGASYPNYVPPATEDYVAPEVWLGQSPTVESDLYSFGAVLYYLATEGETIRSTRPADIRERIRHRLLSVKPSLSTRFINLTSDLLCADACERPSIADIRCLLGELLTFS